MGTRRVIEMMIQIAALQCPLGHPLTVEDKIFLLRRRPDFVCLPEYYFVPPDCRAAEEAAQRAKENLSTIEKLSIDLDTTIIGGSMVMQGEQGFTNTCAVFSRGRLVGLHHKINLHGNEPRRGMVPGREVNVFEIGGVRVGVLLCADVFETRLVKALEQQNVDVIFVPVTSPHRPEDTLFEKQLRDSTIFVRGAQLAKSYVIKTGGIGTVFGHRIQGRSGIFAPWGILAKTAVEDEDRKRILTVALDIDEIREFKEKMVFSPEESFVTEPPNGP